MINLLLIYLITTVFYPLSKLVFNLSKRYIIVYTTKRPILRVYLFLHVNLKFYRAFNLCKVNGIRLDSHASFIYVYPVGAHFLRLSLLVDHHCNLGGSERLNFTLWAFFRCYPSMAHPDRRSRVSCHWSS
jgi:hypothetical protein